MLNLSILFSAMHRLSMLLGSTEMMEKPSASTAFEFFDDVVSNVQVLGQLVGPSECLIALWTRNELDRARMMLVFIVVHHAAAICEHLIAHWTRHSILIPAHALFCKSTTTNQ